MGFDELLALELAVLPSLRVPGPADLARAQMLLVDLGRTARALRDVGILSVVIKGGALLASGRVAPGRRHLDDIDLLVPQVDAFRALGHLESVGFAVRDGVLHDGRAHREHATHQLPMMVAPGGTLLELHVHAHVEGETFADVESDAVDVGSRAEMLRGVRVPAPWRLLRELCAHVVLHHFGETRLWPRHLFDLQAMSDVEMPAGADTHSVVAVSRAVLRGFVDPNAPPWMKGLASTLIVPDARVVRAVDVARVAVRGGRAVARGELRDMVWPTASHLRFTGDLEGADDRRDVLRARWRRWQRLLRR